MIAPQELRIGNFVYIPDTDQTLPVTAINMDLGIWVNRSLGLLGFEQVKPIELTEEWILKFGLKNTETGFESVYGHQNKFSVILFKKFASVGISGPFGLIHIQIKYVHQLQNLYFALTGEELTIKEKS